MLHAKLAQLTVSPSFSLLPLMVFDLLSQVDDMLRQRNDSNLMNKPLAPSTRDGVESFLGYPPSVFYHGKKNTAVRPW